MKKILIVDDEEESIAVLQFLLQNLNYEVAFTNNPEEVVSFASRMMPDLIIMDWIMPQMEGVEVLRRIKSVSEIRKIPVIISTGVRTGSENLKTAFDAGAVDLIKKPIDEIELEARVASAIKVYDCSREAIRLHQEIHNQELEIIKARSESLQNELTKKEREMLVSAVNVFQDQKLTALVRKEILNGAVRFDEKQKSFINNVLDRLEAQINGFNWPLFERRFTELNTDFFNNLKKDFPDLTVGEHRLCALFKLGMSTKEVAILNYSNYEAVRKAVYRIRKKLDLSEKEDLSLFLQKY